MKIVEGVIAQARFEDGWYLQIVPYRDEERNIRGFDSVLLFQNGELKACVMDRSYQKGLRPEQSGFWSKKDHTKEPPEPLYTQRQLAEYWNAALHKAEELGVGSELYQIVHLGMEIKKALEQGEEKIFGKAE